MNIIIAGSRHFKCSNTLCETLENALHELKMVSPWNDPREVTIFSGGASGVDEIGEAFARRFGFYVRVFPALWSIHGKKAGVLRNREMALHADGLILIWDGTSRGSANMLLNAKKKGLRIIQRIINQEK